MDKALYEAIKRVEKIKYVMYEKCQRDVEFIISNKITDEQRIDMVFDEIMDFFEDEDFLDLFWNLVNYVETFDTGIGAFYRRQEEVIHEGF
ncbi:MAG: hypothetical protein ACI3XL_04635 [Eubacteriales bacterium]